MAAGFGFDPQTFAPTYRLNYGSPGSSLALEIANRLGMPADIRQGVLIPTAYYTGDTFKAAPRQPLDSVLHINAW